MDERIVDFVNYVRAHPGIASSTVAEHFDVGVRTVRNWLHEANEVLEDTAEITSDRGSYTLTMHSRRRFERLVAVGNSIWSRTPSTSPHWPRVTTARSATSPRWRKSPASARLWATTTLP